MTYAVPFSRPCVTGDELEHVAAAIAQCKLSGNGPYTQRCHQALENLAPGARALLTHSGTAALEMAAILAGLAPGEEVIMPSFTFVSTANAVVLRGAVPVFVDIRPDTLNIDETKIEAAITARTKAILVVHYAGVGCEMESICAIAKAHALAVLEDAAQGYGARWRGRPLGTFGQSAALSFHETKNLISGEGGALLVNDPALAQRAEIIWEKGTDRAQFLRGEIDKYTWRDIGSSYLPSELVAAYLWAQLERGAEITARRLQQWHYYHAALTALARAGRLLQPAPPPYAEHNGHIYYVLLPTAAIRARVADALRSAGISPATHYVPLHNSPAGRRYARAHGDLSLTENLAARLLRLPLHHTLTPQDQDRTAQAIADALC